MINGLYTVDFHTHVVSKADLDRFFAEDCNTEFFRKTAPLIEKLLHMSYPVHDNLLRNLSFHFRHRLARHIYRQCQQLGLLEAIRLFKTNDFTSLLKSMDREGIDHVVISSLEPITLTQNILDLTKEQRKRVSIFASVYRNQEDPAGYIQSFIDTGSIAGLKIHPLVGGYACGELYDKIKDVLEVIAEADMPVFIHTGHIPIGDLKTLNGCNDARAVEPLLAAFPQINFVLAHIGWESWRAVLDLAKRYPKVYVETSWQPAHIIRRAVDTLGAHRVLFGSDFPLCKQSFCMKQVRDALTPSEFAAVTSANAVRLLKLKVKEDNLVRAS